MSRIKHSETHKSLAPGYYAEVETDKGNRGFGHGSTREDAHEKAVEDAEWKDDNYRF